MIDNKRVLDLGCGKKKRDGAIGVDWSDRHDADVIHDLNEFPYPFENSMFDEIYIDNTLEHLDDVMRVMEEIYRICKPGGLVKVIVPYFRSVWASIDPTHKTFFTVSSPRCFCGSLCLLILPVIIKPHFFTKASNFSRYDFASSTSCVVFADLSNI